MQKLSFIKFLLLVSLVSKLFLLGKGYLASPDEFRHIASQNAFEALRKGEAHKLAESFFAVDGRPGLTLVGMIPASFQVIIANRLHVGYNSEQTAWVIYIYNYLIFLGVLYMIYNIAMKWGLSQESSLLAVSLYSITINSYLYLRHAFPYDASLLLSLVAIHLVYSKQVLPRRAVLIGLLLALSFMVYPGFFPLIMAIGLIFLLNTHKNQTKNRWFNLFGAAAGFVFVFSFFELLAQTLGRSYFLEANKLGQSIVQGSFEESFSFLLKYLYEVEWPLGFLYLVVIPFGFWFLSKYNPENHIFPIKLIFYFYMLLVCSYLFYASLGFFFHKMVQYGRLQHQYFPFLAILVAIGLNGVLIKFRFNKQLLVAFATLAFICSAFSYYKLLNVDYPYDVLYSLDKTKKYKEITTACLWKDKLDRTHSLKNLIDTNSTKKAHFVNWCYPSNPDLTQTENVLLPASEYKIIAKKNHLLTLAAYQFEGGGIEQRIKYNLDKPQLVIYEYQ